MPPVRPRVERSLHGVLVALVAAACIGLNARLDAPPRFDGAGYAVLARSLGSGQGYREIDHPDRPVHGHFPPGYPLALTVLWSMTGISVSAAHVASWVCTVLAAVLAWAWFRAMYAPRTALWLGLAIAVNWQWTRTGAEIQSEPLFLLLAQAALALAASISTRRPTTTSDRDTPGAETDAPADDGRGHGLLLGALLGASILVRHIGVCWAAAIIIDLLPRRRQAAALRVALVVAATVAPWAIWVALARQHSQVGLLPRSGLGHLVADNAAFYVRRLPDMLTGPVVEIGTVFRPQWGGAVTAWAVGASAVIVVGWIFAVRSRSRRLAGLVPLLSLGLLLIWPFTEAGRFLVPLVPMMLVGGVETLGRLAARAGLRPARSWAAGALLAVSIPYSAYAIVTGRAEAARRTHADFDSACAWIATQSTRHGPILTRHPGEAFWLTGRQALAPAADGVSIDSLIDRYRVAFLLIDGERYARAPATPLERFAASRPERVALVWQQGGVAVFETKR